MRPVGFDRDFKTARMDGLDQRLVELQKGLAAGENDEAAVRAAAPRPLDRVGKRAGRRERAAAIAVRADEIRVAKVADRLAAIFFAA